MDNLYKEVVGIGNGGERTKADKGIRKLKRKPRTKAMISVPVT
jgi:hypothetical protein